MEGPIKRNKAIPNIEDLEREAKNHFRRLIQEGAFGPSKEADEEKRPLQELAFTSGFVTGTLTHLLLEKVFEDHRNPLIIGVGRDSLGFLLTHRYLKEMGKAPGRLAYIPISRENEVLTQFFSIYALLKSNKLTDAEIDKIVNSLPKKFIDHIERIAKKIEENNHDSIVIVDTGFIGTHTVPLKVLLEHILRKKGIKIPVKVAMIGNLRFFSFSNKKGATKNPLAPFVNYKLYTESSNTQKIAKLVEKAPFLMPPHTGSYLSPPDTTVLKNKYRRSREYWEFYRLGIKEAIKRRLKDEAGHPR